VSKRFHDAMWVLATGLCARLAIVAWAHARFPPADDGQYYDALARRLASGAGYTWLWPDGAVTYAAHYPVGYPALLAFAYVIVGSSTAVAMIVNAVFGAASAFAAHRLVDRPDIPRWRPLAAGLAVALHPALVPYTAAVMTEGMTASLLMIAAWMTQRSRERDHRSWGWLAGAGVMMGVATLVRPTNLLLVPVWGLMSTRLCDARGSIVRAAAMILVALACVLPWTARNCVRMHRCALVSVNGGWNLLIGVQTTDGTWTPIAVPPPCATVWDEAAKDVCFGREARRAILASPTAWLARAPAKLAATFDYIGAAPSYLAESNPGAFDFRAKVRLGVVDTLACRGLLVAALVAIGRFDGPRKVPRKLVAMFGAAASVTLHGWLGYVVFVACTLLWLVPGFRRHAASRTLADPTESRLSAGGEDTGAMCEAGVGADRGVGVAWFVPVAAAAVVGVTVLVHAVFIGAGRYGLVVLPFVAIVPFCGFGRGHCQPVARTS
jgi:hypothetical protein